MPSNNNNNNNNNNRGGNNRAPNPTAITVANKKPAVPKTSGGNKNNGGNKPKVNENGVVKYSEVARENGWADMELIEGVERDIVEGKQKVSWESIAGLTTAKHLLQEAVVLPLWIPDYFKGILS